MIFTHRPLSSGVILTIPVNELKKQYTSLPIHFVSNTEHVIVNLNNTYQLHGNPSIFRTWTDRQMTRRLNNLILYTLLQYMEKY